jgi:DNA primase
VLLRLPQGADAQKTARAHLGDEALENLMRSPHVAICPAVRHPGDAEQARLTLSEVFGKMIALRGLDAEVAEAAEEMTGVAHEALTWRLREAAEACNRAIRSQQEDRAAYDKGDNGMMIDRDERSAFDALLSKITYTKPGQ